MVIRPLSTRLIKLISICSVNLINSLDDMPHKIRKKAFSFTLQTSNQNSQYKGKFGINLFKLIRDNFSNNYTTDYRFAYTSYFDILSELSNSLRSGVFN